jgi:ATP-binding cassette, subfamily C, bacterial EexD
MSAVMQAKPALAEDLRRSWEASRGSVIALGVFSAGINLLWLVPSLYMLQVYDRVLPSGSEATLLMLSLIVLFLLATMGLLEWVRSQILVRLGERLHGELSGRLFEISFRQSLATAGQQSGAQPLQDLQALRQFLAGPGLRAFFDAPWLPLYVALMFAFHSLFGWLAVLGAAVLVAIAALQEKRSASLLIEANRDAITIQAGLSRTLANADAIEGLGMAARLRARWDAAYERVIDVQTRASERSGLYSTASRVIRLVLQSAVLGTGAWLVLAEQLSPGVMIGGSILLGRALAPIDLLTANWKGFVAARAQFVRLNEWLGRVPASEPRMALPAPTGALSAEGLVVVPPGAQSPVLRGITFMVEAGNAVGIIGPSAAGKSTLARVLLGIWPAAQGRVRLDGAEVFGWDRAELGPHLGYLPQDVELFDGTVAENIARFGEVDSQAVVAAAQLAGVHEMILRLPKGFDTRVAAMGGALTAGQRQRLGLARAVYGEPKLVVLDEPNSNLDEAGDAALVRALAALKARGVTVFVISHRSSILPAVDKLLWLSEGQLIAFGSRDDVRKKLNEACQGVQPLQLVAKPSGAGSPI